MTPIRLRLRHPALDFYVVVTLTENEGPLAPVAMLADEPDIGIGMEAREALREALKALGKPYASELAEDAELARHAAHTRRRLDRLTQTAGDGHGRASNLSPREQGGCAMAIDTTTPLSRRRLIAGALGALGATAAAAVARPLGVAAATDSLTLVNNENDNGIFQARSVPGGSGHGGGLAVFAESFTNTAVRGLSGEGTGVEGDSGSGYGVYGESAESRGGAFRSNTKAQVRLLPGTANRHPVTGAAGDLFVDKRRRLWFCKGGTNWVKLA